MLIHRKNSCCGSKNTNTNSSGGGSSGGGGTDWDVSFNYYFLKKPWSPGYVIGSSFNPPYNWVYGTFDNSSGFYDAAEQRLELNWILPPRLSAGFNFSVPPRQLNDNTINLEPGTYSSVGILDISYNYLPYHETLRIDFRNRTPPSTTWGNWTTLSTTDLALSGNPKPNLYPQTRGAYFIAGVSTITGEYGNNSGNPPVPQFVYQNTNRFPLGNDQYQFRIYLTNSSQEVLNSPDYFGTVDPSWNYLYMPDISDNFLSFGQFGPATPPLFINISNTVYNLINITGANNNDGTNNIDTVNPVADVSLNTLFTQLNAYGLFVNFGFDLSGQLHSSSKQVFVPPVTIITSRSYVSQPLTQNTWLDTNFIITPSSDKFSSATNDIIFPGFEYSVSEYFMRLSSDFSYNVYTTQYPTPTPYPSVIVTHPLRTTVSTDYTNMLSQGTQNLKYSIPSDLQNVSGNVYILATAYPPTPYTPSPQSVYFLSSTSEYKLDKQSLQYSLINKRNLLESTDLGTDLSGQDLCRFSLSTNSSIPQTITSQYTVGFVGNDSSQFISNQYFELGVSESIDATKLPGQTTAEAYRLRGWYLGVDLSNIKVLGINLTNYPDISNNTPAYTDWTIDLKQEFAGNETDKDLELCSLTIGEAPTQSVTLTNYTKTNPLPVLTTDFFGLGRPQNNVVASFTVTGLLSNLYTTWRPSNTIMTGKLLYASANSGSSGNQFDNYTEAWPNTNPPTVNLSEILQITKSDIQVSSYNYSRDRNFTPQFYITGEYTNNVTLSPSNISANMLDISFNGKPLWWDFTFDNTVTFQNVGEIGTTPYNQYPFCQIGVAPDFASTFSHSIIMTGQIANKQLVWAKGGFKHGNWSVSNQNPYILYTTYYSQSANYSTNNTTGETIGSIAGTYNTNDITPWYDNTTPSSFTIYTGPYKVLLLKFTKPTNFNTSNQPCCSLELKLDSTYVTWPNITNTEAANGSKPLVWFLEDKGSTTSTFSVTSAYSQDRTGWKATHKREDTAGQGLSIMNENNMGCVSTDALHTNAGDNQGVKVYDLTGAKTAAYDIYFRILIPNGNNSNNNLSAVRVKFYNRSGQTVSQAISTIEKDWVN